MIARVLILGTAVSALTSVADAQACEVEDWRFQNQSSYIVIEGSATCPSGRIHIRGYEGDGGAFLGNATTSIRGYAFTAIITNAKANKLSIKYVIETK